MDSFQRRGASGSAEKGGGYFLGGGRRGILRWRVASELRIERGRAECRKLADSEHAV